MAAYRQVDDLVLQANCLYTGISSGPSARYRVWEAFTFIFQAADIPHSIILASRMRDDCVQCVEDLSVFVMIR